MKRTTLNEKEKRLVIAIIDSLMGKPENALRQMLGSIGEMDALSLYMRLRTEDFCKARGIKNWQVMDDYDWENFEDWLDQQYDDEDWLDQQYDD